jgi:hypothetical protein
MLVNVLKGSYWCPKSADIRIKNCVKAPLRERLYLHIEEVCAKKKLNIAWIDESHVPYKKWMVDVLAPSTQRTRSSGRTMWPHQSGNA